MKLSIGIDWADKSHAICIREVETRYILAEFEIGNDVAGVEKLEGTIKALNGEPDRCMVAIETNQGILVNYLLEAGYWVYAIPPATVIDYRGRRRRSGAKDDQDDARLLADILCLDRHLHHPIAGDSPLVKEIRAVSRARRQLVRDRTRIINQLKQSLKGYFPHAIGLFSSLYAQIALAFLKSYPTYQAVQQATDDELHTFFQEHHYTRPDLVPSKIAQLRKPCIPVPAWRVQAGLPLTGALLEQLDSLTEHIQLLEKQLQELLARHPDTAIFSSLPGTGIILTAGLLGEIGDCRTKYTSAGDLQALAGTAPITRRSGPFVSTHFRYTCNKVLRNVLQEFARKSAHLDQSSWARAYLSNQIERGHSASRAYRALANRWLVIIYRIWQDRALYDELHHLRNIADRRAKMPPVVLDQVA